MAGEGTQLFPYYRVVFNATDYEEDYTELQRWSDEVLTYLQHAQPNPDKYSSVPPRPQAPTPPSHNASEGEGGGAGDGDGWADQMLTRLHTPARAPTALQEVSVLHITYPHAHTRPYHRCPRPHILITHINAHTYTNTHSPTALQVLRANPNTQGSVSFGPVGWLVGVLRSVGVESSQVLGD